MKVSLNAIKQFINLDGISNEEIAKNFTYRGVEVEEYHFLAFATNLVIGKIISCVNHPDSDHLHILNVDEGKELGVHQIVCGAPNAREGIKVIVALEGCKLNGGTITKSTIRGVESDGMCCSLIELGLSESMLDEKESKGIHELPDDAPIGERDVLKYLGIDDVIFDLKVLANRPDLLSVYNVARELGGYFHREVKIPSYPEVTGKTEYIAGSDTPNCTIFSLLEATNCKNVEAPNYMKMILLSMGIRSISSLVDIGNYVMLMTGQPLNMYDARALKGNDLTATQSFNGKWTALDEKEYDLTNKDIVIASNKEPLCLGGLMTSKEAAISDDTTSVIVEAASFDGATIRRTSNRVGLSSESSSRFVKGINKFQTKEVLAYVAHLLKEICDATIKGISSYENEKKVIQEIPFTYDRINARLSTSFTKEEIDEALTSFGFVIKDEKAIVPTYRLDLSSDADLSEEVIRYHGTDKTKSVLPALDLTVGTMSEKQEKTKYVSDFLLTHGLDKCLTYSLEKAKDMDRFNYLSSNIEPVKILNPLTDEHEYFRLNVLPGLIDSAIYNISRKQSDLALFEIGDVYGKGYQSSRLAIVLNGKKHINGMLNEKPYDFYSMKGIAENILNIFNIDQNRYKFELINSTKHEFHPYQSAYIKVNNQTIGVFGTLDPRCKSSMSIEKENMVVLEIDLLKLFEVRVGKIKMAPISKFPVVYRDLAFVCKKDITSLDLINEIKKAGRGIISSCNVFDIYEGSNVGENMKSIAFNIAYTSNEKTLTDKDIDDVEAKIKEALLNKFSASLRG